ncbi:hypothetical protein RLEG12_12530 [Rhizobium leguminosarum bv. trifolii CB782]|uniref:DUF2948 family protein n=1 Tax=Rhizobium hidalgonense TaxID=1538159 RepID=UPI00027D2A3E|nr:DUF2948 family protein [Rhizobium hidalgonense]AHG43998.1 hypothetical protein RLEG12_12530 [Rhizobium leguminosarum bv. trifolii CB782]EJC74297.1 Protein of unknown function (DUF2948) [Rhizobium leguminosarum bv. trifolii WSM2012]MDR9807499.1 DUF2948 family protein [Rhizobium hidalgonense]RWX13047.1 DUF2948 family protein [Rhizobium hidalgonense]
MTDLKLVALDDEDLAVISAHMQDSVFKVGDIDWSPREAQFALAVNRFVWEGAERKRKGFERRRAALVFKRVLAVRSLGIDRGKRDEVLSLLALRFDKKGDGPEGTIELSLSGTASIALDVECIEVQMADIGGAWQASSKPRHL